MKKYYYHGSAVEIKDNLLPYPSRAVEGEKVVYSTPFRAFALLFIYKIYDNELDIALENDLIVVTERKEGIFE